MPSAVQAGFRKRSEPLRTLKALMPLSKDEKSGKGCIFRVFLSVFSELNALSGSDIYPPEQ